MISQTWAPLSGLVVALQPTVCSLQPRAPKEGAKRRKVQKVQNSSYIVDLPQPLAPFPLFPHVQFSMNE
jgi:hypothetical protein